ncbi:MAG: hypothetical protein JWN68_1466 [Nocardioides sp.]|nr:hypothetical protein [Nocardioides sp.]
MVKRPGGPAVPYVAHVTHSPARSVLVSLSVAAIAATTLVCSASAAQAAPKRVITACFNTDTGSIRVVDNAQSCRGSEDRIRWVRGGDSGQGSNQGPRGAQGEKGDAGAPGAAGAAGVTGATGAKGADGVKGATGASGPAGPGGADRATGDSGATGATGGIGPMGLSGPAGPAGADGATGPAGATGADGLTGGSGAPGPQGAAGAVGSQGPIGTQGPAGPQGIPGPAGATGASSFAVTYRPGPVVIGTNAYTTITGVSCAASETAIGMAHHAAPSVNNPDFENVLVSGDYPSDAVGAVDLVDAKYWTINVFLQTATQFETYTICAS